MSYGVSPFRVDKGVYSYHADTSGCEEMFTFHEFSLSTVRPLTPEVSSRYDYSAVKGVMTLVMIFDNLVLFNSRRKTHESSAASA